jgi:hypothetical protein
MNLLAGCLRWHQVLLGSVLALGILTGPARAQNLLVSLPEDGSWVRLEGDHLEKKSRPEAAEGDLELPWRTELTIKSVGKAEAEVGGEKLPCRWVEFKTEFKSTKAATTEASIQPEPFGTRIYKVLVPEAAISIANKDESGLPITFLPIAKGYRRIAARDPQPVKENVLVVYPMISLLTHYPDWAETDAGTVDSPLGALECKSWKGSRILGSSTLKSSNEGQLWITDAVPFGIAKVQVKVQRFEKDATAADDAFKLVAEINSALIAVETGTDAQSDLPDLK